MRNAKLKGTEERRNLQSQLRSRLGKRWLGNRFKCKGPLGLVSPLIVALTAIVLARNLPLQTKVPLNIVVSATNGKIMMMMHPAIETNNSISRRRRVAAGRAKRTGMLKKSIALSQTGSLNRTFMQRRVRRLTNRHRHAE